MLIEHRIHLPQSVSGGMAAQHLQLVLARRQRQGELEQEAVELGLGQRIGAFLLDRVLGGEDEEGVG